MFILWRLIYLNFFFFEYAIKHLVFYIPELLIELMIIDFEVKMYFGEMIVP